MIYVIVRLLSPIYFIVLGIMWLSIVSDLLFQAKKRRAKEFIIRFLVSLVWPLSLVNKNGRSIFYNSFNKLIG